MNDATAVALYEAGKEAARLAARIAHRYHQARSFAARGQALLSLWEAFSDQYEAVPDRAASDEETMAYKALMASMADIAMCVNAFQQEETSAVQQ